MDAEQAAVAQLTCVCSSPVLRNCMGVCMTMLRDDARPTWPALHTSLVPLDSAVAFATFPLPQLFLLLTAISIAEAGKTPRPQPAVTKSRVQVVLLKPSLSVTSCGRGGCQQPCNVPSCKHQMMSLSPKWQSWSAAGGPVPAGKWCFGVSLAVKLVLVLVFS